MTCEAFEQIITKKWKELLGYTRTLVGESDAEDLLQLTVAQLWEDDRFLTFQEDPNRAKFTTWLKKCLDRRARQWRRDEYRRIRREETLAIAYQKGLRLP